MSPTIQMFELAAVIQYSQTQTSDVRFRLIYVSSCQILHFNQMLYNNKQKTYYINTEKKTLSSSSLAK